MKDLFFVPSNPSEPHSTFSLRKCQPAAPPASPRLPLPGLPGFPLLLLWLRAGWRSFPPPLSLVSLVRLAPRFSGKQAAFPRCSFLHLLFIAIHFPTPCSGLPCGRGAALAQVPVACVCGLPVVCHDLRLPATLAGSPPLPGLSCLLCLCPRPQGPLCGLSFCCSCSSSGDCTHFPFLLWDVPLSGELGLRWGLREHGDTSPHSCFQARGLQTL